MFMQRLARAVIRRRRLVLILAGLTFPLAAVFGGPVASHLSAGGITDPAAESTHAAERLADYFHTGEPNFVVLVTARRATVDDPAVAARGKQLTEALSKKPGVEGAVSYWSLNNAPPLLGIDGKQALILARIPGDEDTVRDVTNSLVDEFTTDDAVVRLGVGGAGEVWREITTQSEKDLQKAEALTVPLTVIALAHRVWQRGRGRPSTGDRRPRRRHDLRGTPHPGLVLPGVDLRPQPHVGHGAGLGHRLQPLHGLAVPRGVGGRARTG